jgi:transketolase
MRPGDANETAAAWALAVSRSDGPVALSLTRQKLPTLPGTEQAQQSVARGGYILREASGESPAVILIGTGSELQLAFAAADLLEREGVSARVVSMPCWELFEAQDEAYRNAVLPAAVRKRVSVEVGVHLGWERWVGDEGAIIGLDHFGASAPAGTILEHLGFTAERVAEVSKAVIREGLHGRIPPLNGSHGGSHPSLKGGDPGVERTGGDDPGHS